MGEAITALLDTPIPTLLVLGGIAFIFLAIFPVKIIFKQQKPSARQQILSAIVGIVMLLGGISLHIPAFAPVVPSPTAILPTDTLISPTNNVHVPTIEQTPSLTLTAVGEGKIAITEVMAAPCGGQLGPNKNEYIELYNYGNGSIDVNGWWITTNNHGLGVPDSIVSWDTKDLGINMGDDVITNTSVIPPRTYAIVVSPLYYEGQGGIIMPYRFPKGTILLTLNNSDYLGLDSKGLLGNSAPLSVIVLYEGTEDVINRILSTYGTPSFGSSAKTVQDDRSDNFPIPVADCYSVERIDVSAPDVKTNWRTVKNGNPGEGNYSQP